MKHTSSDYHALKAEARRYSYLSRGVLWGYLLIGLVGLTSCRKEEVPAPTNLLQYKTGGVISGRMTGRTAEIGLLNDSISLEAYNSVGDAVFYRDTISTYTVRDTGTGPFVERKINRFVRFSLNRFSPETGSVMTLTFPLWRRQDDTAARFLGLGAIQDIRKVLTDSAFARLEARVSNLPQIGGTTVVDPTFTVNQLVWDSVGGRISGRYSYKIVRRPPSGLAGQDSIKLNGQFDLPVTRAYR